MSTEPDDELKRLLKRCVVIVAAAGLPEPLIAPAFATLLSHFLAHESVAGPAVYQAGEVTSPSSSNARVADIAAAFGVDAKVVHRALDVAEDGVRLTIARNRLPKSKAAAMRFVSYAISGARQAARLDDAWTPFSLLRAECQEAGVLDGPNFAKEVSRDRDAVAVRGKGQTKELKMTRYGQQAVGQMLTEALKAEP